MKAFVVLGPHRGAVQEVPDPVPLGGQVVVDVHRVGVCGTDVEFWTGDMAYLHQGHAQYPMRLGHEWCGTVSAVGDGVAQSWMGTRVTGDTMIGCGHCRRCLSGRHNVCDNRSEIGIRGGLAGALAEKLAVPASALLTLPIEVDDGAAAMIEPGGNAMRSVWAADLAGGDTALVLGTGTIGLLTALLLRADNINVHLLGRSQRSVDFARSLDFAGVWRLDNLPQLPWDAVIDATNTAAMPALAVELVEPGKRVVYVGLAGTPSLVDTRSLALKDVTAVGILAASQGLAATMDSYARGDVDPRPLIAATVSLDQTAAILSGTRPAEANQGPKMHIDPRL